MLAIVSYEIDLISVSITWCNRLCKIVHEEISYPYPSNHIYYVQTLTINNTCSFPTISFNYVG